MGIDWGQAGVGVIAMYVLWDLLKKVLDFFNGNSNKETEQMKQLIEIIASKDKNESDKIKDLVSSVRDMTNKMDTLVLAIQENSASFIQVMVRDETNTNRTIQILEKLEISQRRIHDRIDEIKEKSTAIEIYTRSCLRGRTNEQEND